MAKLIKALKCQINDYEGTPADKQRLIFFWETIRRWTYS